MPVGAKIRGAAFPASVLDLTGLGNDPQTRALVTEHPSGLGPAARTDLPSEIAGVVTRLLPTGHFDIEAVGDRLLVHPRTPQRRLTALGRPSRRSSRTRAADPPSSICTPPTCRPTDWPGDHRAEPPGPSSVWSGGERHGVGLDLRWSQRSGVVVEAQRTRGQSDTSREGSDGDQLVIAHPAIVGLRPT
ncbi:MAG: hypothetical protein QM621_12135 [Aeromicrobium sp.]